MIESILTSLIVALLAGLGAWLFQVCRKDIEKFKRVRNVFLVIALGLIAGPLVYAVFQTSISTSEASVLSTAFWIGTAILVYIFAAPWLAGKFPIEVE